MNLNFARHPKFLCHPRGASNATAEKMLEHHSHGCGLPLPESDMYWMLRTIVNRRPGTRTGLMEIVRTHRREMRCMVALFAGTTNTGHTTTIDGAYDGRTALVVHVIRAAATSCQHFCHLTGAPLDDGSLSCADPALRACRAEGCVFGFSRFSQETVRDNIC